MPERTWLPEDDAPWHNKPDLGSGGRGADDRKLATDAGGPLAHAPQSEMSLLPPIYERRVDPCAIVADTQGKVVRVSELHVQSTRARMCVGVADGFVADAVDLIADDGMLLAGIANYGKCDRHGAGDDAVFGHSPESLSEIVRLRRGRAQRIERRPSFLRGLSQPDG